MNNIQRYLFISLLIVLFITLIIFIILYNKLSINKIIPQSEDYLLSESMQKDIEEDKLEEAEEVVTTYYLDASDLKKFEKTKEYQKGKANPFAEVSDSVPNTTSTGDTEKSNGNASSGYYRDKGTK